MGRAIHTTIEQPYRPQMKNGWREGRPVEDPNKTKRWGLVTAKPSEFLVHVRGGRVRSKSSGQGATCFKWPWDAVSVIPTSLQRLAFRADQVTKERVGVEVMGLAVYRIVDPMLAYRVLNFSYPERAQQKLEETLTGMFIGATRRLVANLTVHACLEERKVALADELLREVAPVVGGHGGLHDDTDQGWGVVIDTIEIQEVRVLSEKVFADMQAPYRARLEHAAAAARADSQQEAAVREAEARRAIEKARIEAEREVQQNQAVLRQEAADREQMARLRELERKQQQAVKSALLDEEAAAREQEVRLRALARAREEAEAELGTHAIRLEAATAHASLQAAVRAAELEARREEGRVVRDVALAQAEVQLQHAEIENLRAVARARVLTAEKLPEVAQAMGQRIGEMKVTQIGGDSQNPFASLTEAVAGVIAMARDA